jgi:phytoene synthase
MANSPTSARETQLHAAYATCRAVARSAAKNFYYSFLALPKHKRNALCAVYAFMRHADDISDDEGLPPDERYRKLEEWLGGAKHAFAGEPTDDAVLFALADAQRRYKIPVELFEKLVQGTAMDLEHSLAVMQTAAADPAAANAPVALYATFEDLYQYCYHVASVVGLVCIRIFGYRDPHAEILAERCGIAFQMTNIIRDVKEDASMGRIYLPQQDMRQFGRAPQELAHLDNGFQPGKFRTLLEFEAERAREFYKSGRELIELIDYESRPALWVLIEIYSRLLERIAQHNYDVFSERVRLRTTEKLGVLFRGLLSRVIS